MKKRTTKKDNVIAAMLFPRFFPTFVGKEAVVNLNAKGYKNQIGIPIGKLYEVVLAAVVKHRIRNKN